MKKIALFTQNKGITLIALVVTIIVLLILAGITISLVFSKNGIIAKAMEAANKTNEAIIDEQISLENTDRYIEDTLDEMVTLQSNGSYDENKGMNTPYLKDGMIPVKWNGTNWVKTVGSDKEWYDYSKKCGLM